VENSSLSSKGKYNIPSYLIIRISTFAHEDSTCL
jgi:hypothetical protein